MIRDKTAQSVAQRYGAAIGMSQSAMRLPNVSFIDTALLYIRNCYSLFPEGQYEKRFPDLHKELTLRREELEARKAKLGKA